MTATAGQQTGQTQSNQQAGGALDVDSTSIMNLRLVSGVGAALGAALIRRTTFTFKRFFLNLISQHIIGYATNGEIIVLYAYAYIIN